MASRFFHAKPNYIYPIASDTAATDAPFEFDESDVWMSGHVSPSPHVSATPAESRKTIPSFRSSSKKFLAVGKKADRPAPASVPVSIPDWSKILKDEYRENRRDSDDDCAGDSDDNGDVDDRLPPHEYLARTRGASLSVHEGIGRTLKGRDLRRVRNAIWKKVGFED